MTNLSGKIQQVLGQLYSLRNWIEYGFKQVKNQLGWADFRLTDYHSIERWWEIVFSAYLLVSLHASQFKSSDVNSPEGRNLAQKNSQNFAETTKEFSQHPWWESGTNWKSTLNNLRLIIQPYIFWHLIQPWLRVFSIPGIERGFLKLIEIINGFRASPVEFTAVC